MRNFNLSLFTFSLITLTFTLQPLQVTSTEATIINVCSKTPDATLCETCLRSDPKGVTADIRGLALISIACGTRDADKLYTDTNNVYSSTQDPTLHDLLDQCWWRFVGARDNIDAAGRALGDRGVDAAKQAITDAIPFISFCSDLFNKNPQVAVPKNILDETTIASKDCQIILGILSNIM